MKSREGFVSNSSTSSFIIKTDPYIVDCLKAVGRADYPTAWDAAMSIASVDSLYEPDMTIRSALLQFEDIRDELKYIYIDRLRGCEFLEMPSGSIYVDIDNCIPASWEYVDNKSHKGIEYCDYFAGKMADNYPDDYSIYLQLEKGYPDPNKLFDRDYRHVDTNKMSKYGKSLIVMKDGSFMVFEKETVTA